MYFPTPIAAKSKQMKDLTMQELANTERNREDCTRTKFIYININSLCVRAIVCECSMLLL